MGPLASFVRSFVQNTAGWKWRWIFHEPSRPEKMKKDRGQTRKKDSLPTRLPQVIINRSSSVQVRENIRNKSETFVIQPLGTCTISLTSETKKKAFILPFYFFARKFLEEKTRSRARSWEKISSLCFMEGSWDGWWTLWERNDQCVSTVQQQRSKSHRVFTLFFSFSSSEWLNAHVL